MNTKIMLSTTAVATAGDWINTDVPLHYAKTATVVQTDPNAVIISGRASVNKEGKAEILLSLDPRAVSKKAAIRKLNEELEGRFSPSDTFASRTAG